MPRFISKSDETVRLFRNPVLELFSHIHPAVPLVVYGPVILYFGGVAIADLGWLITLAGAAGGLLLWTFIEYWFHRVLFHYEPKSSWGQSVHFLVHGIHHAYPQDSTRLVMPLPVSVPLALLFFFLFRAIFGIYCPAVFSGFALGYVVYDSMHYAVHHFAMRNRLARTIKRHHLRHHFTDEHSGYGVSSPLWDYVFRTMPPAPAAGEKEASAASPA
jgi:sterol desaturase/sphingolipid hydroxylase (fatty acid hydroxylase superfamily)